jgi:hypothetical protein
MAENNGRLEDEVPDAAALPVVHVAAADARLLDVDADIVLITQLGDGTVLKADVFDGLENEGGILEDVSVWTARRVRADSQSQTW